MYFQYIVIRKDLHLSFLGYCASTKLQVPVTEGLSELALLKKKKKTIKTIGHARLWILSEIEIIVCSVL